ncbi:MAG: rhodanese-like domain-containing protein [Phoenicibacter congonensis]|uniref:Rhodanese-like domain-containing protein n=1 Tax=Phoenicibacter congonensis TaxID=1944646 RepID=A0AA43RGK6_9ACTN|nr:rhodanese-like domain-containing protein [Phoenicibacter congonensis]
MTLTKKSVSALIALALCFGVALGLVGCSSGSSSTDSSKSSSTEVKEVTMTKESVDSLKGSVGKSDVVFLDVRKADDYKAGHIIGAINADMDKAKEGDNEAGLETMKQVISDNKLGDQKLVLVCYSGNKYAQAGTNILSALGYDMSKVVTLEGGMKAWNEAGLATATEVTEVTMTQEAIDTAKSEVGSSDVVFLDVRKADDYKAGHIEGAINADMDKAKDGDTTDGLVTMSKALSDNKITDKKLVLVCYSGKKYAQAATNTLNALGYDMSKVVTLEGGMKAWTEAGNSTVQ